MYYEINVSQNGRHYFATHERSGRIMKKQFDDMLRDFRERFPQSEGFEIRGTFTRVSSVEVDENTDVNSLYR